jgi:LysR family transcriptional regulator, low CO2-responsive transcriptional regulator
MYYAQLRAFHAVATHGGFTRAAESLGLTQPTLSDQVKKLERDFDVALFNRIRKRTSLTETGQQLFEITGAMLDMENQAIDLLSETQSLRTGHLTIAADAPFHILQVIGDFRRRYPQISVAVNIGNSEAVMSQLHEFRADIGVLANVPDDPRLRAVMLCDDSLVAVVPVGHLWTKRGAVKFDELGDEHLILRERGSITRSLIENEFQTRGKTPRSVIEMEGRESVREAVAAGIGIGFVSEPEFGYDSRLAMIQIEDCDLRMRESMVCLEARFGTRTVGAFWESAVD